MHFEQIYDKVNSLIKKYDTRNPEELVRDLNITLRYFQDSHALLGMYKVILRNRYIFIPTNVGSLKKTVLAHELGHDQLHRDYCTNGASFHESSIFNPTNRFEIEANIFAAHLLISDEDVIQLLKYSDSDTQLAYELGVDINLLNLKISEMAKLGLLDIDERFIERPKSDFLKDYIPPDDDWNDVY